MAPLFLLSSAEQSGSSWHRVICGISDLCVPSFPFSQVFVQSPVTLVIPFGYDLGNTKGLS